MRIKTSKMLGVLLAVLSLGLVPVEAQAEQCLSQFPDSAWTHGAPIQQYELGNDLALYSATVTTTPGQNLKGVVVPWMITAQQDRYFLQNGQTILATSTNPVSRAQMLYAAAGQDIDKYLNSSAYSVISENPITQVPITVSWEYRGATCGTRTVTLRSYLDVKPAQTFNIQDPGVTSADLEPVFKSLGILNFLDKQKNFEGWVKTGNDYATTKANPLPLVGATSIELNKYFDNQAGGYSLGFWTNSDDCLIDTKTGGGLTINLSNSRVAAGKSSCKVTAHLFSRLNPTAQVVANLWLKAAQSNSSAKSGGVVTINCIKGKIVKKVTGTNASCPAGFQKK